MWVRFPPSAPIEVFEDCIEKLEKTNLYNTNKSNLSAYFFILVLKLGIAVAINEKLCYNVKRTSCLYLLGGDYV